MTAPPQNSREEIAMEEIGLTEVTVPQQWVLTLFFLVLIFSVPAMQHLREFRHVQVGISERTTTRPSCLAILDHVSKSLRVASGKVPGPGGDTRPSAFGRILDANRALLRDIHTYEDTLRDDSFLAKLLRPPAQAILAGTLGAGNEQAYVGEGGWLFYRPGVDSVTGPGFLEPKRLAARARSGSEWEPAPQPDPLLAILQFHRQLSARGIQLVVMPTPVKPSIHPEKLTGRGPRPAEAIRNRSFPRLVDELADIDLLFGRYTDWLAGYTDLPAARAARSWKHHMAREVLALAEDAEQLRAAPVHLFDPAPSLFGEDPAYLAYDTHWRPETMQRVAADLAAFVKEKVTLPDADLPLTRKAATATHLGDIAAMLNLPPGRQIFAAETVQAEQVLHGDEDWRPDRGADILLLGDSFSNIYSLEEMGWGSSGGFAEHLAAALGRPLDAIIRNDSGAHATRETLSRELARGVDRLAGKRVVIWQFAERELAVGDWRVATTPMALAEPTSPTFLTVSPEAPVEVHGVIAEIGRAPRPGTVPYRDHIVFAHFTGMRAVDGSTLEATDALVALLSMRDNVWTRAARLREGQAVTLRLRNYDAVDWVLKISGINSAELDSDAALEDPAWGEFPERTTEQVMTDGPAAEEGSAAPTPAFEYQDLFAFFAVVFILVGVVKIADARLMRRASSGWGMALVYWMTAALLTVVSHSGERATEAQSEPPNLIEFEKAASMEVDTAEARSVAETADRFLAECGRLAGSGDDMAVEGENRWLFLRAELRHLAKGPFWGERASVTSTATKEIRRDPLPAIVAYKEALAAEGIEMIFLPVPPKAVIFPDHLGFDIDTPLPRLDPYHQVFYELLRVEGVAVADLVPGFLAQRVEVAGPVYCRTDTHWSPRACAEVASGLARVIRKRKWYAGVEKTAYSLEAATITVEGDLLRDFKGSDKPVPEQWTVQRVPGVEPDRDSPVVLLADSHGLVFHAGGDMFTTGAGLADHLAFQLGFPIDVIAVKGSGATPTRIRFYRRIKDDPGYLAKKKVVIWCVSAREFTETDGWATVPLKRE